MGLDATHIHFIITQLLNNNSVLQLGRQDVSIDYNNLLNICRLNNFKPTKAVINEIAHPYLNEKVIDDNTLFRTLGFNIVESIDYSNFENATFTHDLNNFPPPDYLSNKYDLIIDGGTSEHIFSLPNLLKNIHYMLAKEGKIIHIVPSSNCVDHGFYSFSPCLFYEYYMANQYIINEVFLVGRTLPYNHKSDPFMMQYDPTIFKSLSFGGFTKENFNNCEIFFVYFCATKNDKSTSDVIPQQGVYSNDKWKASI